MAVHSKTMKKPAASSKTSRSRKKPASPALTSAKLKSLDDDTHTKIAKLNKKMADFKNGAITEDKFDGDDKHKLWDRFHKKLRGNDEAAAAFDSIVGHGKSEKKNT